MTWVGLEWTTPETGQTAALPVEVRDRNLALVARTTTSRSVNLEPGYYVFTARLPAGDAATRVVEVAGEPLEVLFEGLQEGLSDDPLAYLASPRARQAVERFEGSLARLRETLDELKEKDAESFPGGLLAAAGRWLTTATRQLLGSPTVDEADNTPPDRHPQRGRWSAQIADASNQPRPATPVARLKFFQQSGTGGFEPLELTVETQESSAGLAILRIEPAARVRIAQLLHPNRPPVNLALPTSASAGCLLLVHREPERYWVEVQIEHPEGNLLLGYQRNDALPERREVAERLLAGKFDDPVAAALGAYTLLRFGDLERLHDWTTNLHESFPWLPDGAVLRGEHMARLGHHERALTTFLEVRERGLPLFSDGLAFLDERLSLYRSREDAFEADALARAERVLDCLQPLLEHADLSQPFTTFTGLDPERPDAEPTGSEVPEEGVDLRGLFSD